MKIVAITNIGAEFLYSAKTAHKVPKASANTICNILNQVRYNLTEGSQKWFVYDVDEYDRAYDYAQSQSYSIRNGIVKRNFYMGV